MNRAVQARLDNPNISAVAALCAGGFVFGKLTIDDTACFDSDGVSLSQRKNQLSRRMKTAMKNRM